MNTAPNNLSHKPIIAVNDYDKIDAKYVGKTDVRALSIGQAQYDSDEISLKVWRHTGKKWSRQSEELPIHRSLDLNILLLSSLMVDINSNYPGSKLGEEIVLKDRVEEIKDYFKKNKDMLAPRIKELQSIINTFCEKENL
jgi:hypothetical protein